MFDVVFDEAAILKLLEGQKLVPSTSDVCRMPSVSLIRRILVRFRCASGVIATRSQCEGVKAFEPIDKPIHARYPSVRVAV